MPTEIERLYREHRAGLIRLVERELHDHHDAEDVVQTAFLNAQCALERGTIPRNPRAWLAAIALNAAHRLRRRRLNVEALEEYAAREASGVSEIRAALTSLPAEQRAAVLYRDVLGLSYGETAEQMGTSVNAVTMLLHRGRQRLRQTLGVATGGPWFWRWFKQGSAPQIAVAKGAAAVVVAAGLATGGIVAADRAARAAAPITPGTTAVPEVPSGSRTAEGGRMRAGALTHGSVRHSNAAAGSKASAALASTHGSGGDATSGSVRTSQAPTALLSTLRIPTLPVTVAATVTVSTPITTATVSIPTGTTVAVTTPITTVTVPIP